MATTMRASGRQSGARSMRTNACRDSADGRGKTRAALEILALIIIAVLLIVAPIISRSHAGRFETATVLTEPGDTLWTIASEHPVPGLSTLQAVEIIAEMNALESDVVPAGVAVEVPLPEGDISYALK